jgi:hypothetical protein
MDGCIFVSLECMCVCLLGNVDYDWSKVHPEDFKKPNYFLPKTVALFRVRFDEDVMIQLIEKGQIRSRRKELEMGGGRKNVFDAMQKH